MSQVYKVGQFGSDFRLLAKKHGRSVDRSVGQSVNQSVIQLAQFSQLSKPVGQFNGDDVDAMSM